MENLQNRWSLSAAVGPQQINNQADVLVVQKLLNLLIAGSCLNQPGKLSENGIYDQRTQSAIEAVEELYFYGTSNALHRIDPESSLFAFLNAAARQASLKCPVGMLSSETDHLAAIMVPGGVDKLILNKNNPGSHRRVDGSIRKFLPAILKALNAKGVGDVDMLLVALATIRAESAGFQPISEGISKFNTSARGTPGRHPFDLYDNRRIKLGNLGAPDGANFKGRGFVQLTGRDNYDRIGRQIGLGSLLLTDPEKANDPDIAAMILAQFLANQKGRIREALKVKHFRAARACVNGGYHGSFEFETAYKTGHAFLSSGVIARARNAVATSRPRQ